MDEIVITRPQHRQNNNIKTDKETRCEDVEWIHVADDLGHTTQVVRSVRPQNLTVSYTRGH